MGFGDERVPEPRPDIVAAAKALADKLYPDMDTVPGGSNHVHTQLREQTAKNAAIIFRQLELDGLVVVEDILEKYEPKGDT